MKTDKHGGIVSVYSNEDINERARLTVGENGGCVEVFGRGRGSTRAGIAVTEYGNGAVSTWDKNGYRLASLK